jgi:hypothetical protein
MFKLHDPCAFECAEGAVAMPTEHWNRGGIILIVALVSLLSLSACAELALAESTDASLSQDAVVTMNFHMYSIVYVNSDSSILVYNGADTNPPTYSTPATRQIFCTVRPSAQSWFTDVEAWFSGFDAWFGGVSWITQPLAEDMRIQGNVSMRVWLSATGPEPFASGYALGISEVDSMGNFIGEPMYGYYYSTGDVLGSSPRSIELTFNVDRTFTKGNIIGFLAIVGSTTEGWQFQVYFDSPDMNSSVTLPMLATPIPEFSRMAMMGTMAMTVLCAYLIVRRKS